MPPSGNPSTRNPFGGELLGHLVSQGTRHDREGVLVVAEHERQLEQLAFGNPVAQDGERQGLPLDRADQHALGNLPLAAELRVGEHLDVDRAGRPLVHRLRKGARGDGGRVDVGAQGAELQDLGSPLGLRRAPGTREPQPESQPSGGGGSHERASRRRRRLRRMRTFSGVSHRPLLGWPARGRPGTMQSVPTIMSGIGMDARTISG